jgi:hypothetical protein
MNVPESIVAEQIDVILKRTALSLEKERISLLKLPATSPEATAARLVFNNRFAAFDRLRTYRAKFY